MILLTFGLTKRHFRNYVVFFLVGLLKQTFVMFFAIALVVDSATVVFSQEFTRRFRSDLKPPDMRIFFDMFLFCIFKQSLVFQIIC